LIGLAPRRGFRKDILSSSTQGWFIQVFSGDLIAQGHRLEQTENTAVHMANSGDPKRFGFWSRKTPPPRSQEPQYRYWSPIPQGSIVTVLHDRLQHTIAFQVNGQSLGIAFTNIPDEEPLYAAVEVYGLHLIADIHIIE
jgi:hypothetical protein